MCSKCQPTLICTYCGRTSPEEVCRQCSNTYCQYRTNPRDFSYSADTTQIDSSRSLIHDPSNNPDLAENAPTVLDKNCVVCNPELIADGNQYICSVCAGGHEVTHFRLHNFRSQSYFVLGFVFVLAYKQPIVTYERDLTRIMKHKSMKHKGQYSKKG